MNQNPEWTTLLESIPQLKEVLKAAKAYPHSSPYFCGNSAWFFAINRRSFKEVVEMLTKGKPKAYEIASKVIYFNLPDCKKCYCKEIGLRPKSKRMLQIKQLFEKLAEISDWCNRNPSRADQMFKKAEPFIKALEKLEVDRLVAEAALYLCPVVDDEFLNQFEKEKK